MPEIYDVAVIGGGVVGTAIARRVADVTPSVLLLEKEAQLAVHTSGRNSGVIHSGIYYKPETLPAKLCARANQRLFDYCQEQRVRSRRVGKIIVAYTEQEQRTLDALEARAKANGVLGVRRVEPAELKDPKGEAYEPNLHAESVLWVPSAAILDNRQLVYTYAVDFRKKSGTSGKIEQGTKVESVGKEDELFRMETSSAEHGHRVFYARYFINAAGLHADEVAHRMGIGLDHTIIPFRGDYLEVAEGRQGIVKHLVYPPPNLELPFLGVHFTPMVDGSLTVGPNAILALGRENYNMLPYSWRKWAVEAWLEEISDLPRLLLEKGFWNVLLRNKKVRRTAPDELLTSLSAAHAYEKARKMVPSLKMSDIQKIGRSGIRAQLVERKTGNLVNEVVVANENGIYTSQGIGSGSFKRGNQLHVLNAISPGMTLSLEFADWVVQNVIGEDYLRGVIGRR